MGKYYLHGWEIFILTYTFNVNLTCELIMALRTLFQYDSLCVSIQNKYRYSSKDF